MTNPSPDFRLDVPDDAVVVADVARAAPAARLSRPRPMELGLARPAGGGGRRESGLGRARGGPGRRGLRPPPDLVAQRRSPCEDRGRAARRARRARASRSRPMPRDPRRAHRCRRGGVDRSGRVLVLNAGGPRPSTRPQTERTGGEARSSCSPRPRSSSPTLLLLPGMRSVAGAGGSASCRARCDSPSPTRVLDRGPSRRWRRGLKTAARAVGLGGRRGDGQTA